MATSVYGHVLSGSGGADAGGGNQHDCGDGAAAEDLVEDEEAHDGGDRGFQEAVPGTKGQPHTTIHGGGHFLQEDKGEELARVIVDFIAGTRGSA